MFFFLFVEPDEDTKEKSKFLTAFSKGVTEANNMLHLGELGADLAEKVLQYWMSTINRTLTNYQVGKRRWQFTGPKKIKKVCTLKTCNSMHPNYH